jgi:hypothetical protein
MMLLKIVKVNAVTLNAKQLFTVPELQLVKIGTPVGPGLHTSQFAASGFHARETG